MLHYQPQKNKEKEKRIKNGIFHKVNQATKEKGRLGRSKAEQDRVIGDGVTHFKAAGFSERQIALICHKGARELIAHST
eukprot:GABW01002675.1.p2 GENE.GABW01002675.1~~GABW01002675.1.p2  ORF type:complete len:79 (-),score=15.64 GABW01002675.1:3-239(-)